MTDAAAIAVAVGAAQDKDQAAPPTKSRRGIECTPLEKQVLKASRISSTNSTTGSTSTSLSTAMTMALSTGPIPISLDAYADTLSCSVEELRATHKKMKRAFFKLRAANVDQQRTLKSDVFQACVLWNLKTVTDVHRRF